jgi:hypothetical protein
MGFKNDSTPHGKGVRMKRIASSSRKPSGGAPAGCPNSGKRNKERRHPAKAIAPASPLRSTGEADGPSAEAMRNCDNRSADFADVLEEENDGDVTFGR